MAVLSIPTGAQLPSHLRIDCSNKTVQKSLNRLSRSSLLSLALSWAGTSPSPLSSPLLLRDHLQDTRGTVDLDSDEEEDYENEFGDEAFVPAQSLRQLCSIYENMKDRKGPKSEVLGRIMECDWKHGISLYQLAMADFQYLTECPSALKWSAFRIVPLKTQSTDADPEDPADVDNESLALPSFHPPSFLRSLQSQVLPDVKAHYCFDRHGALPLMMLRILILDSPYNTNLALQNDAGWNGQFDSSRAIYVAFPDSSPYVYISRAQTNVSFQAGDAKTLHSLILEGIPKAMSRPRERFTLRPTNLSTRNLSELVERRGPNRTNRAGGGWSYYSDKTKHNSPLLTVLPDPPLSDASLNVAGPTVQTAYKRPPLTVSKRDERIAKRARTAAKARFGDSNQIDDGRGVERVDIVIHDPFSETDRSGRESLHDGDDELETTNHMPDQHRTTRGRAERQSKIDVALERGREAIEQDDLDTEATWRPDIKVTFHGTHVFAGIRQLVEHGIIDGERMPGWMTGQEGVTVGVVRHGRIRGREN